MILYTKKEMCCGCAACMNICPKQAIIMKQDEEGFVYPFIDQKKCINCGLCKKVCALQNEYEVKDRTEKVKVYAAKSKDTEIRKKSSSGGIFTLIANEVLKENGVIYGAAFDKKLKVKHIRAENQEEVGKCRGSKYSQSEMESTFKKVKEDLKNNRKVFFTGTPCQVAGLRKYLDNTDRTNLILMDIVCHGTPSPKLFNEYIKFIEKDQKKNVAKYNHRSKTNLTGIHTEEIIYENGEKDSTSRLSQTWRRIFYSNLCLRPSCYSCQYTNEKRPGDITAADFWGIEKFNQSFYDKLGISLLLINTKKGEEIFQKIQDKMFLDERKMEEAIIRNPQLKQPVTLKKEERERFWKEYQKSGIKKIARKYGKYTLTGKIKHKIKEILKK